MLRNASVSSGKYHRVYVFGLRGSGKTTLLQQLVFGGRQQFQLHREQDSTIEDIYSALIDNHDRGTREKVHLFETSGFASLQHFTTDFVRNYLPYADGIVLVYSITSKESFSTIELVKRAVDKYKEKKEIPIVCLGNKKDRFRERQVDSEDLNMFATKERLRAWEVSSTDRSTLIEPFVYLAAKLNPPQSKSAFPRLGPKGRQSSSIALEL